MSEGARRIHYLSHASIPSAEANSIQVMKMCEALARQGHEVVLYCKASGSLAEAHAHYGVAPIFRLEGVRGGKVRFLSRALYSLRVFARSRRDRSSGLLYGRDYYTMALAALTNRPALPLVFEAHQPPGNPLERWLQRVLFRSERFRRLVVISRALAEEYERLFGELVRGRVTVAPDGADLPSEDVIRPPDAGGFSLGYVGNLYPGKGMERIAGLAERFPGFRFHVIGGSPRDTAHWKARVGGTNVVFHGHVPHAEAQARMRACNVLLAPFQRAVWIGGEQGEIGRWMSPLKVFEYMASGRPMIASDLPVLREVLQHGSNALLVEPEDPEAWARAIEALSADEALRGRLAARARDDLAQHYTWDRRAQRILADCWPLAKREGERRATTPGALEGTAGRRDA